MQYRFEYALNSLSVLVRLSSNAHGLVRVSLGDAAARSVLKLLGEVRLSFDLNWMTRGYGRPRIRICTRRAGLSARAVNRIRLRATVGCEKLSLGKMAFTSMVDGGFFEAFSIKDISPRVVYASL